MKSLKEYIYESQSSKSFTFDFSGIEGGEDIVKSIQEIADKDGASVSIDGAKATLSVSANATDALSGTIECITDFVNAHSNDQKRASDESYAQKLHKLEDSLAKIGEFIDDVEAEADAAEEERKETAPAADSDDDKTNDDKNKEE